LKPSKIISFKKINLSFWRNFGSQKKADLRDRKKERKGAICFYGSSFLGSLILCVPPKEKEKEKKSTPLFTGHTLLLEGSRIW
jgi:hypothetical protein